MTVPSLPWAILVAGKHAEASASGMTAETRLQQTRQLIARAETVATPAKTCAIIAEQYRAEWRHLAANLAPSNLFLHPTDQPILHGIERCLREILARDPLASAMLIPADHCAEIEASWVTSARGALQLGVARGDLVYMLHDKPQNDPRVTLERPDICSSSVLVGSIRSLLALCDGRRSTEIVDLMVEDKDLPRSAFAAEGAAEPPLKVVHVTSIEEYARLQRGDYTHLKPAYVDVRV